MTVPVHAVDEGARKRFLIAAVVAAAVGALDISWTASHLGGGRATQYFSDLIGVPVTIAAAIACWATARRELGRARWGWTLLGAGVLSWGIGEAIWSWYELGLNREVPFPSFADVGYLGLIPLAAAGLLLFPTAQTRLSSNARALLDGLMIVGSLLFVSWATVLGDQYREGSGTSLAKVIGLTYPIGDVVILSVVLFIATRAMRGARAPFALIGIGLVALSLSDSLFTYLTLHGSYSTGSLIDPWWEIGFLLIGLGAVRAGSHAQASSEPKPPGRIGIFLPYVAVAFVVAIAVRERVTHTGLEPVLFWLLISVFLLALARQLFTIRENLSLAHALEARVQDLARANTELIEGVREYAIYRLDANGRVQTWNTGAERITGFSFEEIEGHHLSMFFPTEESGRAAALLRTAIQEGRAELEGRHLRRDGSQFVADIVITPLADEAGRMRGFSNVTRDITDRMRAQREREQLEEQLNIARRLESLGRLAAGVAHDFNNLLAVILNYAAFARQEVSRGDNTTVIEDLDQIRNAADRGAAMTRQLLTFGSRDVVSPQLLDTNEAVRAMEKHLAQSVGPSVRIVLGLDPGVRPVRMDPVQLDQLLTNLALNARDAMPEGGMLEIRTKNEMNSEGRWALIAVGDTGQGMEQEVAARAFEPFFTTKPKGEGTGLGLATVYGIVVSAGGHVTIDSEPGRGTKVSVLLPASPGQDATPEQPAERDDERRS